MGTFTMNSVELEHDPEKKRKRKKPDSVASYQPSLNKMRCRKCTRLEQTGCALRIPLKRLEGFNKRSINLV